MDSGNTPGLHMESVAEGKVLNMLVTLMVRLQSVAGPTSIQLQ